MRVGVWLGLSCLSSPLRGNASGVQYELANQPINRRNILTFLFKLIVGRVDVGIDV